MNQPLDGRRILVVEDESLVAMLIETILEDMGCRVVGPVSSVDEALKAVAGDADIEGALLDVNVGGREVFPVAYALKARGIPFVFSTGYGQSGLPEHWRGQATIQKPFTEQTIRDALMAALGVANV